MRTGLRPPRTATGKRALLSFPGVMLRRWFGRIGSGIISCNRDLVADPGPASRRLDFRASIEIGDGLQQLVREAVGRELV